MRLTRATIERATQELIDMVNARPGLRTSQLTGTPHFHGVRTLSLAQGRKPLHASPEVTPRAGGVGRRTWTEWWPATESR